MEMLYLVADTIVTNTERQVRRYNYELQIVLLVILKVWEGRIVLLVFFFSSRRRHTRFDCDWSSDVCSSDLYREFELLANIKGSEQARLTKNIKVESAAPPGAGFEKSDIVPINPGSSSIDFLASIAAARHEVQTLFEITRELGNSLSLDETLSMLAARLKHLVPYDSIAIYSVRNIQLAPEHVSGDNFRLLSSLRIPIGEGVSGWVAANRKPIVNGNLATESEYLNDPTNGHSLRSVLAVPLEGVNGVVGVLALYRTEADAFTRDHLRILLAISSKIALSFENALKYRQSERTATTDYLTSLPNARSLFIHLDSELARCRRHRMSLAVLVCDLDGFKQINDRFGHLQGNRLLTSFAEKLKQTCREYDYVAGLLQFFRKRSRPAT